MTTSYTDVIQFWFSDRVKKLWFNSTPEFDREIHDQFVECWQQAQQGLLEEWRNGDWSSLALVIVLDQFPLNMFRGEAKSFATEAMSREVSRNAILQGYDNSLDNVGKAFLYLPFMHSEDPDDQDYSVQLFENAGLRDNVKWAMHHREIIRRFGRFPHRNAILGRESTPDEVAYLNSESAFLG